MTSANALLVPMAVVQGALIARLLGVSGYGLLAVGLSFTTVVAGLLSFRMQELIVKWVTLLRETSQPMASTVFRLGLVADVGVSLVGLALVELLAGWVASAFAKDPAFAQPLRLLGLTLLLQCGRESWLGILTLDRRFRNQAAVQVAAQATSLLGVLVAFLLGAGVVGVVAALLAGEAVRSTLLWTLGARAARRALGRGWLKSPLAPLGGAGREMLRFAALTNAGATLGTLGKQGDALFLSLLLDPASAGYYKLAQSMTQLAVFPVMPLATVTYPELSSAVATRSWRVLRDQIRQGTKLAAAWFVPVSIGLGFAAPALITLIYGADFVPAASAFAILLVGLSVDGALFWNRGAMLALGRPGYLTRTNLVVALVKLALTFALVPFLGYMAMAGVFSLVLVGGNAFVTRETLRTIRAAEAAQAREPEPISHSSHVRP
ncbi:MAG: lipopolysaccharide biosynthesis protein [Armatimonadetes bacterium]|nr:lipopolysaccharide biosynthesis protein [Armatimonadota bacterium]